MTTEGMTQTETEIDYQRPRKSEPLGTPQLKVRLEATVRVEQDLDLLRYLQQLPAAGRQRYMGLDLSGGYEEWERPVVFLSPDEGDFNMQMVPIINEVSTFDRVDIDESEVEVRFRTGSTGYVFERFGPEDFNILREHVPWLDHFHTSLEAGVEDAAEEDIARIPGPFDIPLDLE